jgi:aspartate racemase
MKKIGLIGGMSWESTELYYRNINTEIKNILGGHHSAKLVLESVDFEIIKNYQHDNNWEAAATELVQCAKNLEKVGAEFVLICTNTMHKVAPEISESIEIPVIHLADATAERIKSSGFTRVGFLGTKFSMEDEFYVGRLRDKYGLTVEVPNEEDRKIIHNVIYDELCLGQVLESSRVEYLRIMDELHLRGVECIIEGCTEIVMLVDQTHTEIPLFDTTMIHAQEAAKIAVGK